MTTTRRLRLPAPQATALASGMAGLQSEPGLPSEFPPEVEQAATVAVANPRLPDELQACANVHVEAVEHEGRVVFLHSVREGPASRSYGIHVAALAGMPRSVLTQARRELARLEARAMEESRQPQLFACEPGEDLPPEPEPQCIEVLPAWHAPLADVDPRTLTLGQAIEWFERLRAALRAAENEAPRLTR